MTQLYRDSEFDLIIVLPVYNPREGWMHQLYTSIDNIMILFKDYKLKIIVVDDGSEIPISVDFYRYFSDECPVNLVRLKENKGKGFAIRYGLVQNMAQYYIYTDFDFPFGEQILFDTFINLQEHKLDLVLGKRKSDYVRALPFKRKILTLIFRCLAFFYLSFRHYDTQTGLKGMTIKGRDVIAASKTNSFIFELEFVREAIRRRLSIGQILVTIKPTITFSEFGFKVIKLEFLNFVKLLRSA